MVRFIIRITRFLLAMLILLLATIMLGEAASNGNPAAMVVVAVIFGVFIGAVAFALLAGAGRHYHVHYHAAQPPTVSGGRRVAPASDVKLLEDVKTR